MCPRRDSITGISYDGSLPRARRAHEWQRTCTRDRLRPGAGCGGSATFLLPRIRGTRSSTPANGGGRSRRVAGSPDAHDPAYWFDVGAFRHQTVTHAIVRARQQPVRLMTRARGDTVTNAWSSAPSLSVGGSDDVCAIYRGRSTCPVLLSYQYRGAIAVVSRRKRWLQTTYLLKTFVAAIVGNRQRLAPQVISLAVASRKRFR